MTYDPDQALRGDFLIVFFTCPAGGRTADSAGSIRCNGELVAEEIAAFLENEMTVKAKVFYDPPRVKGYEDDKQVA